jgi:aspartyl/asparaginyl-tRNA synthetase
MRKAILAFLMIGLLIATTACSVKTIADVKKDENVGKKVTVQGNVESSIKIGSLSGYRVKDDTDTIGVLAQTLPKEGETVKVTGILMKDSLFGYYIKADE